MLAKTPSLFGGMGGELILESGDTGTPRVIFRPRSVFLQHLTQTLKELAGWERLAEQQNFSLWIAMPGRSTPTRITGENSLFLSPLTGTSLRLGVPPGGFYQINLPQNRILSELILHILEKFPPLSRPLRVLDLFCGMGNFSIPLAHAGCQVTGVDNSFHAIETARKNKAENKIKTAEFTNAKAETYLLACLNGRKSPFDILILDPPRTGARAVAETLAGWAETPPVILYVSCDPMTLARDLGLLMAASYKVVSVTPIDMFPQTFHIETVTILQRSGSNTLHAT